MWKMLESAIIYFCLVFRPRLLVKIAREYLEGSKILEDMNDDVKQFNQNLQSRSCKQDREN
jgi:hypothetical protein